MMKKIYGAEARQDGLYRVGREKYEVIVGFGVDDMGGFNYREKFKHRPAVSELKAAYHEAVNEGVQEKILKGFEYDGSLVWLDANNQRDYLAFAVQVQGGTTVYPIVVKLGTEESPRYVEFGTAEEYMSFFDAVMGHIREALHEGWEEKESVEWSEFEDVKEVS